nr:MAG TPA: hypothetical protein [Caudoviricetes sp.]
MADSGLKADDPVCLVLYLLSAIGSSLVLVPK